MSTSPVGQLDPYFDPYAALAAAQARHRRREADQAAEVNRLLGVIVDLEHQLHPLRTAPGPMGLVVSDEMRRHTPDFAALIAERTAQATAGPPPFERWHCAAPTPPRGL